MMHFTTSNAVLTVLVGAASNQQVKAAYTDTATGIDFQTYHAPNVAFSFGIALPAGKKSPDFIGHLVIPLKDGAGWGGISLGGGMINKLLFCAWLNEKAIVTSFRETSAYANPAVYNGKVSALTIEKGTFVNATHLSYTFLCKGCLLGGVSTIEPAEENSVLGFAVAMETPTNPMSSHAALTYHGAGFGEFGVAMGKARSEHFATWAAIANASSVASTGAAGTAATQNPSVGPNSSVPTLQSNKTYDVIVVGGGASGIIVAERLAEAGQSVLLLERGPPNTPYLGSKEVVSWNSSVTPYDMPALYPSLGNLSSDYCSDTASKSGCLFGGSSSVNGLNFIHPAKHDFERWPKGWRHSDIKAAASRLYKRNPGTTCPSADGKHYHDRPFYIMRDLLQSQGWKHVDSIKQPNEKHQSFSRPAWSITTDGTRLRAGPARTYMPFADKLDTFQVEFHAKVSQLERKGSKVTGVYVVSQGNRSRQLVKVKEGGSVILAAGALSTPRVLWNSGIGRFDALEIVQRSAPALGLTFPDKSEWIDLPVGHSLRDHAQLPLQFQTTPVFEAYDYASVSTSPNKTDVKLWATENVGQLTQPQHSMHMWTSVRGADGRRRFLQGTVSDGGDGIVRVGCFLTHGTDSTGELSIDETGNTILKQNPWLRTRDDKKAFVDFLQWLMDVAQNRGQTGAADSFKGNSNNNTTMKYIKGNTIRAQDLLGTLLVSGDHWVGSARMGKDDGRKKGGGAVVDLDTRVYGTDNLFVVDASMHPDLPTGNTQAMVMVVAEHAAKKIGSLARSKCHKTRKSKASIRKCKKPGGKPGRV